jgi:hypothetical protein
LSAIKSVGFWFHNKSKHLRVLESAVIVKDYLEGVSAQWDVALGRLKSFVEE